MALIVQDIFHKSASTSIVPSNEKRVEEEYCSEKGMACAASAPVHNLKPDTMSLADLKSRSVTLGRRKQDANLRSRSPSEFTRVRRLNTFRCEVKRPSLHRKLVGKAFSVSGDPSSLPTSSFEEPGTLEPTASISNHNPIGTLHEAKEEDKGAIGKEVVCVVIPSSRNERDDSAINEDEDEEDVQEVRLRLTRFPSDSNTSSLSEDSSVSSSSPYLPLHDNTCSICHNDFCSMDAIVYFASLTLHLRCFRCGQCGQAMGNLEQFLVSAENLPMCCDCTPKCHSCGKSILRNHINVLGNDFHEGCLACSHCNKKFNLLTKVYASNGEPCCANCITPVFNEMWSSTTLNRSRRSLSSRPTSTATLTRSVTPTPPPPALPLSPSTDSGVSEGTSNNEVLESATVEETHYEASSRHHRSSIPLPAKLESLSRGVSTYLDPSRAHNLLRPSLSDTTLSNHGTNQLSISSLRAILYDEYGVLLFMNYCMNAGVIELVVFWLDVEHFKHFDGGAEDLKLFAHHIVLKYVGYYAELPISIPKNIQTAIMEQMQSTVTQDMFDQAQQYVYVEMERHLLRPFMQSEDGCNYLQMLVERDLCMMTKISLPKSEATTCGTAATGPVSTSTPSASRRLIQASITKFDKRHLNTKFYVYEVSVERGGEKYVIYRRYSEWYALNRTLVKAFPKLKFPVLPKKILLGRSQIRAVAKQRMQELQTFLQGILSMPLEVLNSDIMCQFLTQTEMDKEDELFNKRVSEIQERNDRKSS